MFCISNLFSTVSREPNLATAAVICSVSICGATALRGDR